MFIRHRHLNQLYFRLFTAEAMYGMHRMKTESTVWKVRQSISPISYRHSRYWDLCKRWGVEDKVDTTDSLDGSTLD